MVLQYVMKGWILMSVDNVRNHLKQWGRDGDIIELDTLIATVDTAARALGVEPCRIAKTLSFRDNGSALLVVAAGDARVDNSKFKSEFNTKARMLDADEVLEFTGHGVGGVCPFGLKQEIPVYLDISLKRFDYVYPACGSTTTAIRLTPDELYEYSAGKKWVDVCKDWV
jgi:prolyl-tRNA editing enzyme YbaK/EbsC (Cys-tRNA(Pro) deacylase)